MNSSGTGRLIRRLPRRYGGLLYEVSTTPKPGLVDRNNSGSHKDMDFFTFLDSSASLIPWFREFFCLGWDHSSESDRQLFERLRYAGQRPKPLCSPPRAGSTPTRGLSCLGDPLRGAWKSSRGSGASAAVGGCASGMQEVRGVLSRRFASTSERADSASRFRNPTYFRTYT